MKHLLFTFSLCMISIAFRKSQDFCAPPPDGEGDEVKIDVPESCVPNKVIV